MKTFNTKTSTPRHPDPPTGGEGSDMAGRSSLFERFFASIATRSPLRMTEGEGFLRSQMKGCERGITIIETIIVVGISVALTVALFRVLTAGYPLSRATYLQQRSTEGARLQLERIRTGMRAAREGDTGAYPLVEMSPQRIIFYSDIDADTTTERVRYELVGTTLERGLTEPSGDPLTYDWQNDEQVNVVASNVRNGSTDIFTYYNGDYPADQVPLTPVDLTEVKYIQFHLIIDADPNAAPDAIDVISQVQLRNLKTNLGDT